MQCIHAKCPNTHKATVFQKMDLFEWKCLSLRALLMINDCGRLYCPKMTFKPDLEVLI